MHEASIVFGLLEIANGAIREHLEKNRLTETPKVREIACQAGLLGGFEIETLKSCFELFAEKTLCEGADLTVEVEPLECVCKECGKQFSLTERRFLCPHCGSINITFSGGHGLVIKEINLFCEEENG